MLAALKTQTERPKPLTDELPAAYADRLGRLYSGRVSDDLKKQRGQFFTPLPIARFMAGLADCEQSEVSILDPGCGACVLSCALVEQLVKKVAVKRISLTAYETDSDLLSIAREVLEYLSTWLDERGIVFKYSLHVEDFILDNHQVIAGEALFTRDEVQYDLVITNPPYFKLSSDDPRSLASVHFVNGHPNIYSIFLAASSALLKAKGQMIFITPRSFSSGNYFASFRNYFFSQMQIEHAHLFHSRKQAFERDGILQETVILSCRKTKDNMSTRITRVSSSNGSKDLDSLAKLDLDARIVLDNNSREKVLYLPTSEEELQVVSLFRTWDHRLSDFEIQISTGPVVAFRATDFILNDNSDETCPLFWLHNVKPMELVWPLERESKGQYMRVHRDSASLLLPNKSYVLLRRFSSKDDRKRLIAAPYFGQATNSDFIGVENKVNYIYRPHGHLDRSEVTGLCALLNSQLFDQFFRIFNGNVNVSATELRMMPMPPLEAVKKIGEEIIRSNDFTVEYSNDLVQSHFATIQ